MQKGTGRRNGERREKRDTASTHTAPLEKFARNYERGGGRGEEHGRARTSRASCSVRWFAPRVNLRLLAPRARRKSERSFLLPRFPRDSEMNQIVDRDEI